MQQGMSSREAGRQAVRQNRAVAIVRRLYFGVKMWLASAAFLPLCFVVVYFVLLALGGFFDDNFAGRVSDYLLSHIEDNCDQPLGGMLSLYWLSIIVFAGFTGIALIFTTFCRGDAADQSCWKHLFISVGIGFSTWWLIWPFATLWFVSNVHDCSNVLLSHTYTLLSFDLLGIACAVLFIYWPILKRCLSRCGVLPHDTTPTNLFERIEYKSELFGDNVDSCYPCSCSICMDDFQHGNQIIATPCANGKHVFHSSCLADWLNLSETCPLCRTEIARRPNSRRSRGLRNLPIIPRPPLLDGNC